MTKLIFLCFLASLGFSVILILSKINHTAYFDPNALFIITIASYILLLILGIIRIGLIVFKKKLQ